MARNAASAPGRDHQWAVRNEAADFACTGRGHLSSFEILVCWNCRRCMHCADEAGCAARRRPGFPEYPEWREQRKRELEQAEGR